MFYPSFNESGLRRKNNTNIVLEIIVFLISQGFMEDIAQRFSFQKV